MNQPFIDKYSRAKFVNEATVFPFLCLRRYMFQHNILLCHDDLGIIMLFITQLSLGVKFSITLGEFSDQRMARSLLKIIVNCLYEGCYPNATSVARRATVLRTEKRWCHPSITAMNLYLRRGCKVHGLWSCRYLGENLAVKCFPQQQCSGCHKAIQLAG